MRNVIWGHFEWDLQKELKNIEKHGISFQEASLVFADPQRIIGAGLWRKGEKIYEKNKRK